MIKKTLALYAASGAALCAVLTACGGAQAPDGPALPRQTATVASESHADGRQQERYDRDTARRDSFVLNADAFPDSLKIDICDAAFAGGAPSVRTVLTSEDYPFMISEKDLDYNSAMWVRYCNNEL